MFIYIRYHQLAGIHNGCFLSISKVKLADASRRKSKKKDNGGKTLSFCWHAPRNSDNGHFRISLTKVLRSSLRYQFRPTCQSFLSLTTSQKIRYRGQIVNQTKGATRLPNQSHDLQLVQLNAGRTYPTADRDKIFAGPTH